MSLGEISKFKWMYWGIVAITFVFLLSLIGNLLGLHPITNLVDILYKSGPPLSFIALFVSLIGLLIIFATSLRFYLRHGRGKRKREALFIFSYAIDGFIFILITIFLLLALFNN